MINLCEYKDMLGEPGKGVHSYRIFNIAIVDLLLVIVIAYVLSNGTVGDFVCNLGILLGLGVVCHRIFCVRTTVDKILF